MANAIRAAGLLCARGWLETRRRLAAAVAGTTGVVRLHVNAALASVRTALRHAGFRARG